MNSENANPSAPTPERIMQFAWGYTAPIMIDTAIQYKLFDRLDEGPKTARELAQAAGVPERGIVMLLNALLGLELLTRTGERYANAPETSAFLVSSKPSFYGRMLRHTVGQLLEKWMQLPEIIRTGKPAFAVNQEAEGGEFFAAFVESLFPLSYPAAQALAKELKIAETKADGTVLDLAAGSGVWGIGLAQASPALKIHAVDWPEVLPVTERVARRFGLGDRFHGTAGDLMKVDFGTGHQYATLGHILHSEGAERSRTLLKKTFQALAPGGVIAIMEFLVNKERTGPPEGLIFAVNMLVNTEHGDTFSFEEIAAWLREAGFENPRLLDVPAQSPLILANRPR